MTTSFYPLLWNSIKVTLRAIWRAVRQFFHEAAGSLFGMFAVYGAVAAWREWHNRPSAWLLGFTLVYTIAMLIFAITSFRRSRRIK